MFNIENSIHYPQKNDITIFLLMLHHQNSLQESSVQFVDFLQLTLAFNVAQNIVAQGVFKLIKIRGNFFI